MTWDASKSPGDLITSSDWNDMVSDQKGHASRHSDGGSDELDAADLAGGLGTSGQVLQSDGSAASWVDFQSGIDVTNLDGSSGTSGQFLQTDGTNLSFASVSTKAFEEVTDFSSIPSNPETGKGFTTTDKGGLFVEVNN